MGPVPVVATSVLLFLTELSTGQRRVTVQKGPLYRAKGYPVSIACNVTGHKGPSEQTFQWSIYQPDKPEREIQIISTKDRTFTYAFYSLRVQTGDIYVERIQGNSVLLHIGKLQPQDAGKYECHTPSTDGNFFGSYSDTVNLIVIPDTLSVTMSPQTLNREEGESLALTCEVSKATTQHTHLSVSWYRLPEGGGNQATEIISLSKDFILIPGSSYTERFLAGDVRLDKTGNTGFRLSIGRLLPVDQGQLFCEATEWIQDPDETWTFITRKQTDKATVMVQPEDRDFQVNISVVSSFAIGQPLRLICSLLSKSKQNQRLQVVWYLNDTDIGSIDASGVLDLKKDYEERANLGELQVSKINPKAFTFTISSMGPQDEGVYRCEVAEMASSHTDFLGRTQTKRFADINIQLRKPTAKNMELSMENGKRLVWEGETLIFRCKVNGAGNPLSVVWRHIPVNLQQPELIGSLETDGIVHLGPSYKDRGNRGCIRLEKENMTTFRLEIFNALMTDGGAYECKVTEFQSKNGGLSWAQKTSVTLNPLNSGLHVTLHSRQPNVKLGDTADLSCIIRSDYSSLKVPITVTWRFQPRGSLDYQRLVTVTHNGTIEWGYSQVQWQKKIRISQSSHSQLLIHDATKEDTGIYQCQVEAYRRETQHTYGPTRVAAMVVSHPLGINITLPDSQLMVKSGSQVQEISINMEAEIKCSIISQTKGKIKVSVTWYFLPLSGGTSWLKILKTNQDDIVQYGDDLHTLRRKQKFHSEKISKDLFQLHILNMDNSDQGTYHCTVEEWLWTTGGSWYKLGEKESEKTELKLKSIGSKLNVMKTNYTVTTPEHKDVAINCSLENPGNSESLFSVVWFFKEEHSGVTILAEMQHDNILKYGKEEYGEKLHCYRSSAGDFVLKLQSVEMTDSGTYWCNVEEWQLHANPSKWVSQASDESGRTQLMVLHSEPTFSSRICSSSLLLHVLVIYPFIIFIPLLIFTLYFYRKTKKFSLQSSKAQKEKALWVDLKGAEGNILNYNGYKSDEKPEEEEENEIN
ncbi:immunoglobulin superfamily member 2 [Monodelphis domestica]|uniref:immunoglobulin superfamily member 2 n=1 Tax=Monodelphis domestica TaxID=13616 RepID=UPI0024E198AE|nr:immunoglobulin superfamily member 2 [Monodelphis domestica]